MGLADGPNHLDADSLREIDTNDRIPKEGDTVTSYADLMSPEDAEKYLKFLEKGSEAGLTREEKAGIKNLEELIALEKVDYQDALNMRNADDILKGGTETSFTWKLRGEDVTLTDVKLQDISYVKRNSTELQALRDEFNTTTRKAFLEDLGKNTEYLRSAGFSENDILKIKKGNVPDGWQVHHKLPLDDSGTNSFDNLVLIQNEPCHKIITNYQNNVAKQMKVGEVQTVQWPIPNGNIYPAQH